MIPRSISPSLPVLSLFSLMLSTGTFPFGSFAVPWKQMWWVCVSSLENLSPIAQLCNSLKGPQQTDSPSSSVNFFLPLVFYFPLLDSEKRCYYSLSVLPSLQIRILISIHIEKLYLVCFPFVFWIALLIFSIRADLCWEHQSGCSLRAIRCLLARRRLGKDNGLGIWREILGSLPHWRAHELSSGEWLDLLLLWFS